MPDYSYACYNEGVDDKPAILRDTMRTTRTTQSALARMSGVHQPSISQFLAGTIDMSDVQLDRLLACMGRRLEVVRRAVEPELTRSERRSWALHRELAVMLDRATFASWRPKLRSNLERLQANVFGQPHASNIDHWAQLIDEGDLARIRRVLTRLDRSSIEMREVSPFGGLLPESVRIAALREAS